jgi:hypothetical protein
MGDELYEGMDRSQARAFLLQQMGVPEPEIRDLEFLVVTVNHNEPGTWLAAVPTDFGGPVFCMPHPNSTNDVLFFFVKSHHTELQELQRGQLLERVEEQLDQMEAAHAERVAEAQMQALEASPAGDFTEYLAAAESEADEGEADNG